MVYFWSQKTCLDLGFIAWWSCLSSSQLLLLLLMLWLLLFQDALNWCHSAFTSDGLRNPFEVLVILKRVLSHLSWDESAVIVSHSGVASADFFFFFPGEINTNQWTGKEERIKLKVILGFFLPEIPSVPSSDWSFQGLDGCKKKKKKKRGGKKKSSTMDFESTAIT